MPTTKVKVKKGDTLNDLAREQGFGSYKEAGATGYKSGNPDLIFEGEEISFGGTPAPAGTGADASGTDGAFDDPTDSKGFKNSGIGDFSISSEEDAALEELINNSRKGSSKDVNEKDIRRKNLDLFRTQIDSVNKIYDSLVAGEQIDGADRLGQGRAISNRQGLVGSARGETQRQNIVARNSDIMQSIQAERSYKIGQILGEASKMSLAEIQAERDAKRQSASDYLKYLGVQDERRDKNMKSALASLISQGYKLEDLSKDELADLSKNLRVSTDTLRSTYDSLLPEDKTEYFNLSAGQTRYAYNPKSGKVEAIASVPKGGKSTSSSSSSTSTNDGYTGYDDQSVDVLTFDEFKATPEAEAFLKEAEQQAQQNFIPEKRDQILREAYDLQVAELEKATNRKANDGTSKPDIPSLENLTTTNKAYLEQSGLSGVSGNTQTYFLNTPTAFKQYFSRQVASGAIPRNASFDEVDAAYSDWYAKEEGGSSGGAGGGDPFDF